MEEIGKQYINAKTRAGFQTALDSGKVSDSQVAFIEDEDLIWARGKYYGTIPNEEDLTKDTEGKLQLSDRSYNPENFSGLGRIILRKNMSAGKNILTQEMISQANTVYEIRYDFDLSGATINIPENCTLDFQGGSLKNGTLNGDNYNIKCINNYKIFYSIKFIGNIIFTNIFKLDWFCKKYISKFDYYSFTTYEDSSIEINDAFSCGIRNFTIPSDKFFYLKHPIIVNGDIDIINDNKNINKMYHRDYNEQLYQIEPCFITREIDTMFIYNFETNRQKKTLLLDGLRFANFSDFNSEIINGDTYYINDKYDIPIIKIINKSNHPLVKPIFNFYVNGRPITKCYGLKYDDNFNKLIVDKRINGVGYQYTGVFLEGPMYFTELNGYFQNIFQAFKLNNTQELDELNNGFNCMKINANFWTMLGGDFNHCGNPIVINGFYQSGGCFHEDEYEKLVNSYFRNCFFNDTNFPFKINMNGFIYDLGVEVDKSQHIFITKNAFDTNNVSYNLNTDNRNEIVESLINTELNSNLDNSIIFGNGNLLNTIFYSSRFVDKFKYTIKFENTEINEDVIIFVSNEEYNLDYSDKYKDDNENIIHIKAENNYHLIIRKSCNKFSIQNINNLLNNKLFSQGGSSDYDSAFLSINSNDVDNKTPIENNVYIKFKESSDSRVCFIGINGVPTNNYIKKLNVRKNNNIITRNIVNSEFYSDSILKVPFYKGDELHISNKIISTYLTPMINIIIPTYYHNINLFYAKDNSDIASRKFGTFLGLNVYDNSLIYSIKDKFYNIDGELFNVLRNGNNSQRPNNIKIGFKYMDNTLGKNIYWDGKSWIDSNGNPADALKKGTTSQRPTGVQIGYTYKDTDLGKWIIWGGDAWENIDGSPLE